MAIYAVTGASGHLGRLAIQQLLARGVLPSEIVAVVRSRPKQTIPSRTPFARRWPASPGSC